MLDRLAHSFNFIISTFGQKCTIKSRVTGQSIELVGAFKNPQNANLVEQVDFEERKFVIKADDLGSFKITNGDELTTLESEYHIAEIKKHFIGEKLVGYELGVIE